MARVIHRENNLAQPYKKHKDKGTALLISSGVLFVITVFTLPLFLFTYGLSGILTMLLWILTMVCFIFGGININKARIYKSGLVGEAISQGALSNLPDDYYVLPSINIEYEGKISQLDHLIVGPTGVFIVETKNVKGYIVGTDDDKDITIHKVGQKGGQYESKMYNPTKQVGTHVYRTSGFLREYGIHTWVAGMVYFTNPASTVHLQSNKIPVFSESENGGKEICNYILNYDNRNPLSEEEINKIVNIIGMHMQKGLYNNNSPYVTDFDILESGYMNMQAVQMQQMQQNILHNQAMWHNKRQ